MSGSRWSSLSLGVLFSLFLWGCGGGDNAQVDGGAGSGGKGAAGQAGNGGAGGKGAAGQAGNGGAAGTGAGGLAGNSAGGAGAAAGGSTRDGGVVDASVLDTNVPPPAMLTVTILDRRATTFELLWTAPSNNGAPVSGYQVRYAKVPITATNFDDTTVTTAVTYSGTPKMPGDTDGMTVRAYIENEYYFAVTGTDSTGAHVGTFMAIAPGGTCTCGTRCCASHFNVTQVSSTSGTNEQMGHSISGDGDVNGDGRSDIIVGTLSAGTAYLFFGSTTFTTTPPAPSVVFSSTSTGFGYTVAQIGDIDHDGFSDLAISDPLNGEKVYIYKGRSVWPATLTDLQADYVISTDASYANSFFGFSMARLGDFTGDGIDDFAIGARSFGGAGVGRVVIIPGKTTGFASVALPDTSNAITIDGDSSQSRPFFGYSVLGLGHFFTPSSGTTLIVSAAGSSSATATGSQGHLYAFHGQIGTGGAIAISGADSVLPGPGADTHIGTVLTNLETMLNSHPGVGVGNVRDTVDIPGGQGGGYLLSGTPATGPFASNLITYATGDQQVGGVIIGGGVSGRDVVLSLIGDVTPDLVFAGEGGSILTISDGAKIAGKSTPNDLASTAEVKITLPSGWSSGEGTAGIVPDISGDGLPDFCIGSGLQPGAFLVYW